MSAPQAPGPGKFAQMTARQKATFILKVIVCMISFGFIFPNIMRD